jgi:hypothetical protein
VSSVRKVWKLPAISLLATSEVDDADEDVEDVVGVVVAAVTGGTVVAPLVGRMLLVAITMPHTLMSSPPPWLRSRP